MKFSKIFEFKQLIFIDDIFYLSCYKFSLIENN